ncbi:MAG: hypothetical protein WC408_04340 [Candidatus Micrarchaeia archaeon]|jgi:glutaredoxin
MNEHGLEHAGEHHHYGHVGSKGKIPTYTVYAVVALVCLVVGYFAFGMVNPAKTCAATNSTVGTCPVATVAPTADLAKTKAAVAEYLTNLIMTSNKITDGVNVTISSVTTEGNMNVMNFDVVFNGAKVNTGIAYVALDGKSMILGTSFDLTDPIARPTPVVQVKSAKPVVEAFIMSFCPYGTQAEQGLSPVVRLLNGTADIQLHFIVNADGSSLHGQAESDEDARQLCIARDYPAKLWAYVDYVNANCTLTDIGTCWKNASNAVGVDSAKVQSCFDKDGAALLAAEAALSTQKGASASPTLFINGVLYEGARDSNSYKTAICKAFNTAPSACNATLSGDAVASTGSC